MTLTLHFYVVHVDTFDVATLLLFLLLVIAGLMDYEVRSVVAGRQ
jgi:hypothetical protein